MKNDLSERDDGRNFGDSGQKVQQVKEISHFFGFSRDPCYVTM